MNDRIAAIKKMIGKTPSDVFLHYSLAKEYQSAGDHEKAVEEFAACRNIDDQYLPAYVEAGKCLRSAGRLDDALEMFAAGMELAALLGLTHERDYIQQQLDGLPRPK